jgi:triacylglycerol lipase
MQIPKLRSPIVLVHGLFGFDRLKLAGLTLVDYFAGIPALLRRSGNRVLVPCLTPTAGVAVRAQQLKDFLEREAPGEPVHLIAHSMGGLDARYLISCLGGESRVLSLTTLGTPHRGTAFADWGIQRLERLLKPIFHFFSIPGQAFYDLTTSACRTFNERVRNSPRVRYLSVAGQHDGHYLCPEWLLPYGIVQRAEGPNDGLVSVASATFGESVEVWEGDHLSLINWPHLFARNRGFWRDPAARYGPLLRRLADEGF